MVYDPADDEITEIPIKQLEKPIVQPVQTEEVVEESSDVDVEGTEPNAEQLARLPRVSETIPLRAWYSLFLSRRLT
jgi:hypothetical protein